MIDALLADNAATGCLANDVPTLLSRFGHERTAEHCRQVAAEAERLAARFGADQAQATAAGWLHDISAVFPGAQMAEAAEQFGLPILPEERRYPPILHQKLSAVLAERLFAVSDPATQSAIGCHTTLRAQPTALDMVVFLADKLAWDQDGTPPFAAAIRVGLDHSLERGALAYLGWMHEQRASLAVVHPCLRQAYEWLAQLPWGPAAEPQARTRAGGDRIATLHLMVGLPCSGKTTLARRLEEEHAALRLTPDEWQIRLFGQDADDPDHDRRHDTIEAQLWGIAARALTLGVDVILDFGFWARVERDDFRARAAALGAGFRIHFLDVSEAVLLERLRARNARLPEGSFRIAEASLRKWIAFFQAPTPDELT